MIRTEREYQDASKKLKEEKKRLAAERQRLKENGYSAEEIANLTDPIECFHQQLVDEVRAYERLMQGDFEELYNLRDLQGLLIKTRIYRGMSQKELAQRLGVSEAQISKDERNEYHGITLSKMERIFKILGVKFKLAYDIPEEEDSGVFDAVKT